MLGMLHNKKADAAKLMEYVNVSSLVSLSRYTRLLRANDLLSFHGSKRKGYYSLTPKGEKFLSKIQAN
jgi:predicted transcriptional regulator